MLKKDRVVIFEVAIRFTSYSSVKNIKMYYRFTAIDDHLILTLFS
jgi:hypothetical protein